MKSRRLLLLCVFIIVFLAASCHAPMPTPTTSMPEFGAPDPSTGQDFLREGKGICLMLEILPDTETTGWIVRINLYSAEQQDGLRVSIFSRSSLTRNCSLEIKMGSQTPIPSEYSPTIMSWDVDMEKDQSLV